MHLVTLHIIILLYILAHNFWLNFDAKALRVGLYAGHTTQPLFNSQSRHGMDH